ncbi:peptide ABC transporter substrate-binding protein [soil metagenome]
MLRPLVVALALLLGLIACDRTPAAAPPATPGPDLTSTTGLATPASPEPTPTDRAAPTLRYAIAEPAQLVPMDAVSPEEKLVVDTLFDSLTRLGPNMMARPSAATEWEASDDARVWRFTLRAGAAFHDGSPVTSGDFAFAWSQAAATGRAGFLLSDVEGYADVAAGAAETLAGVRAVDDLRLEVRLSRPRGDLPVIVAHPALAPLATAAWQADEAAYRRAPVGNGPFSAAEDRAPRQFLRVQAFPGWRNGERPAELDEVLFQFLDAETAYLAFQQDRLQVGPLPREALDAAQAAYGTSVDGYRGPGVLRGVTPSVYFLGFNVRQPPFDVPDVRRAISLALDRDAMAAAVQGASAVPASSVTSPLIRTAPAATCSACTQDRRAARQILAEHGVTRLEFTFNSDGGHQEIANQVRRDLRAVGVRSVRFSTPDFDAYLDELRAGDAGFFRFGWTPEHPTPGDVLEPLFSSDGTHNYAGYADPGVDQLLAEAGADTSALRRGVLYLLAERRVVSRDQVVTPLFFYRHQLVVSPRVEGFVLDPMGLANLEEVRLAPPANA